ncbi:MAG: DHHA1 domain-containing protein, partial [Clostridiales bacterium]
NMKMVSVAFNSLQYRCDGRLCSIALDKKSKIMHQADDEDCRNIVSFTLNTQGVEVGIFFDECDDFVRISFRCRNSYAVDVLANYFGGGGHIFASGCRIQGTLQEIYPLVMAKAEELFA